MTKREGRALHRAMTTPCKYARKLIVFALGVLLTYVCGDRLTSLFNRSSVYFNILREICCSIFFYDTCILVLSKRMCVDGSVKKNDGPAPTRSNNSPHVLHALIVCGFSPGAYRTRQARGHSLYCHGENPKEGDDAKQPCRAPHLIHHRKQIRRSCPLVEYCVSIKNCTISRSLLFRAG